MYITVKNHKESFLSYPLCRLIKLSKSELGKISKIIIEQVNKRLLDVPEYQEWKNLPEVNFLDATIDLKTNTSRPYRKTKNTASYIHRASNHTPELLKRLPTLISKILSRNSSNKQISNSVKPEYKEALKKSEYQESLE